MVPLNIVGDWSVVSALIEMLGFMSSARGCAGGVAVGFAAGKLPGIICSFAMLL
jgi:hypothetical protein